MDAGTITRRMDSVLCGLEQKFKTMYTVTDFERKIAALRAAGNRSNRPSILAALYAMFDCCGIAYEKDRDCVYYTGLVKCSPLPDFSQVEERMIEALYSEYRNYPSPEEYMTRIVNKLASKEDGWAADPLRLRILKQFIKYGNYLADAEYGGRGLIQEYVKSKIGRKPTEQDVPAEVDDKVFDGLEQAAKAQKRPDGKYGLLKLADDLAGGKFRAGGATKRGLYLLAMVYGMTYYSGAEGEKIDFESDIETNLFRDYYANNLMRFLSDAYKGKLCEFELDPSGQGINYKNFAEMIYLYYISKDYPPADKIRLASQMIKRVQQSRRGHENPSLSQKIQRTHYMKGRFFRDPARAEWFSEDILRKTETEFEQFICENYDCNTMKQGTESEKAHRVGMMQLEEEQNTAFENYQKVIQDLNDLGVPLENCNYGLWFTDVAAFKKKGYRNICDRMPEINRKKFEEFIELLLGINNFLGYTAQEEVSSRSVEQEWLKPSNIKTRALYVSNAAEVTRTSLIVAYYYYYNALHEDDGGNRGKSFEEWFNHFKEEIDVLLTNSYYQPLSGKNIFDVLVAFSSYAYVNI